MQDTGTMGTVTAEAIDEVTSSITYSGSELSAMVDIWEK